MRVGENIRKRRLELGMTQEELANRIGVQKSAVAKYESGRVENIKRKMVPALADALGCDPAWLLGLKDGGERTFAIVDDFKTRFNEALSIRGIKPVDLAKKCGLSESTVSQYRSGYAKPKDQRLTAIANALGVQPMWLMGMDVPMTADDAKASVGRNIKKIREKRGLTQEGLSNLLGVSQRTVSSWETDRTEPSIEMIGRICKALDCQKTDIIESARLLPFAEAEIMDIAFKLSDENKKILLAHGRFLLHEQEQGG